MSHSVQASQSTSFPDNNNLATVQFPEDVRCIKSFPNKETGILWFKSLLGNHQCDCMISFQTENLQEWATFCPSWRWLRRNSSRMKQKPWPSEWWRISLISMISWSSSKWFLEWGEEWQASWKCFQVTFWLLLFIQLNLSPTVLDWLIQIFAAQYPDFYAWSEIGYHTVLIKSMSDFTKVFHHPTNWLTLQRAVISEKARHACLTTLVMPALLKTDLTDLFLKSWSELSRT